MNKGLKNAKREFFYWRMALRQGLLTDYLKGRYSTAPALLRSRRNLEKPANTAALSMHVLCGKSDLTMMVWAIASLYHAFQTVGSLHLHNDGTLGTEEKKLVKRYFPSVSILDPQDALKFSGKIAPFPLIRKLRADKRFSVFRKLIDPYLVSDSQMRLVVDSDVFWFRRPDELEADIAQGCPTSFMMANNGTIPVYYKDGSRISDEMARCNSGIVLYRRDNFILPKLEEFLSRLDLDDPRNFFFSEQAGYASALMNLRTLPEDTYSIKKGLDEKTVVRHYTRPRRIKFYTEALPALSPFFLK